MNWDFWMPAFVGLLGAAIGAGASVFTVVIQSRNEIRKNRTSVVAELALTETNEAYRRLRESGQVGVVLPAVVYMHYYEQILTAIDSGAFDADRFKTICRENREFMQVSKEMDAEAMSVDEDNEAYRQAHDN